MPLCFGWGFRIFQTASHAYVIHIWGVWALSQIVDGHMASHSHCYHHRNFFKFGKVGWYPTWCRWANHATIFWLRLQNLSNCISWPCHTYMRCLSTFSGWGWEYGYTLTPLLPQMFPTIWGNWLKSYLMEMCKPCHYALVEAVEPFKLHPMSMSYIYEVFEHLLRFWLGILLHTHTVTTTAASPDSWGVGWYPTWCKYANHATTLWLRLQNLLNCIPCQCHIFMRGLSTLSGCGWDMASHSDQNNLEN